MTYFDRNELYINKVRKIYTIDGDNTEMINKIISENIRNTISQSRL